VLVGAFDPRGREAGPDLVAADLPEAADIILGSSRPGGHA
jgi:hypothetical protein